MIFNIFEFICAFLDLATGLRDTPFGQFLRLIGFKSYLHYPEEIYNFQAPSFSTISANDNAVDEEPKLDLEAKRTMSRNSYEISIREPETIRRLSSKNITTASLVTWYSEDDPENPRNWNDQKKSWVIIVMTLYTFVVYCTASIITPTAEYVMQQYNVSIEVASLGLSLYVVGYGVGPMFFSPISEIPFVGRNPPYIWSFVVFFLVSIIIAVVDNFPAMVVLRFLQGFFGSPILASGGATIEDIYDPYSAPYAYIWWIAAMYCGPAFGPLFPAWAVASDWRWALWITVIMASVIFVLLPFMPETSPTTIILHRARRLRLATGNPSYLAPSELKPLNLGTTFKLALSKPGEITIKDPAIAYACIYGSIIYGTYYSFFEVFPIVFLQHYKMSLHGLGLIFTGSICGGCLIGVIIYYNYIRHYFIPRARHILHVSGQAVPPEAWLRPGLIGVFGPPVGLFLFAWTAKPSIHWIVPTVGIAIFAAGSFVVFQGLICYIPLVYPKYVASLFAANDFARSMCAAAMVMTSRYMYENLGVARGVTLVGGLSVFGVVGLWVLWWYGAGLRARSRFTGD
ncbi:uncharacterized protein HMPREF1541_08359 [Cyphellophora europaea CBS 101466]|uniref:Major facilitator superfamily (MFS) profile domain-containing protein n=1 Tax=Cyphellophora europaea (strain CBS 101466) TaxID=1220924 RepID=W2RNX0_CYPE1|nr:uncharacterized protein HMPREF1541_08359 [Cyphellophora europaea CBS 101466]ETN37368.1 hypothetical protein HMPREF1541_08359 [Cyphellophora europaea CBS 101466]